MPGYEIRDPKKIPVKSIYCLAIIPAIETNGLIIQWACFMKIQGV